MAANTKHSHCLFFLENTLNLRPRFFIVNTMLMLLAFVFSVSIFWHIADNTVKKWSLSLAEKQLLYDKTRAVQYITKEIFLSKQMSTSKVIINWAKNQDNKEFISKGIEEMDNYRLNFTDGNYFIAFLDSGKYYYNNSIENNYSSEPRYILDKENPDDAWFYTLVHEKKDFHINVNPDTNLGVTKLWVDFLLKDGDEILGVLGTGLDLRDFINKFADAPGNGVTSIFIDHSGAIQVYFDQNYIDFSSITKSSMEHKSISSIFEAQEDIRFIKDAMNKIKTVENDTVLSKYVKFNGSKYLAGITYIPEIDWYEITLYDVGKLLSIRDLSGIILAFIFTLAVTLITYHFSLRRYVLSPVLMIESAINRMKNGDYTGFHSLNENDGEFGRLMNSFEEMAHSVRETTVYLEKKVAERTEELNRISVTDPLTGLLNRRGMKHSIEAEMSRAKRHEHKLGILWLDIDFFKYINDQHGHNIGDKTLIRAASVIEQAIRQYDTATRWGGDEFLVMLPHCDERTLEIIAERIRNNISKIIMEDEHGCSFNLTTSIGGYLAEADEEIDRILNKADKALYVAKDQGRNQYYIFKGSRNE